MIELICHQISKIRKSEHSLFEFVFYSNSKFLRSYLIWYQSLLLENESVIQCSLATLWFKFHGFSAMHYFFY